jgi:ABC-type nitrate/sulfonate/bicarbonate transport system substrate-binding protein
MKDETRRERDRGSCSYARANIKAKRPLCKYEKPERFTKRFIFVAFVLASLLASAPSNGQDRVRAGYSSISGYQVPLWLGADLGLFKKHGLNLEPVLFRGGAESAAALAGGEIQFDVVAPHQKTILLRTYLRDLPP